MGEILSQHPPPPPLQVFYFFKFHLIPLSVLCSSHTWLKGKQNDHYACQGKTDFDFSSGSTSGPPQLPASGNSALLGGVVKGANSFFSNIKDMSNKVMQSVAGYVQHFCGCSWELLINFIMTLVYCMCSKGRYMHTILAESMSSHAFCIVIYTFWLFMALPFS